MTGSARPFATTTSSSRRRLAARVLPVLLSGLGATAACTTTTTMAVGPAASGQVLVVDGVPHDVPADGRVAVEVGPGFLPVPWELRASRTSDVPLQGGALARSEPVWGVVLAAAAAAACCVPSLVVGGMCLANPTLFAVPLVCLASPDVALGACIPTLQAPTWLTVPAATAGAGVGLAPLALGLVAQAPPAEVTLADVPPPVALRGGDGGRRVRAVAALSGGMSW